MIFGGLVGQALQDLITNKLTIEEVMKGKKMPNIKPTQQTLSNFSSEEIRTRTCTHTGTSKCLECDAWDELKKIS